MYVCGRQDTWIMAIWADQPYLACTRQSHHKTHAIIKKPLQKPRILTSKWCLCVCEETKKLPNYIIDKSNQDERAGAIGVSAQHAYFVWLFFVQNHSLPCDTTRGEYCKQRNWLLHRSTHTVVDNWKLIFCYFSFHVAVTLATKAIYIFCRLRLQCFNLPQNPEFCFFVQIHRFIVGRMRNDSVCTEKPEKSCCCCCCVLWGRLPDHRCHSSQFSHCVHRPRTNDSSFTGLRDEKPKKKQTQKTRRRKAFYVAGGENRFMLFSQDIRI